MDMNGLEVDTDPRVGKSLLGIRLALGEPLLPAGQCVKTPQAWAGILR